MSISLKLIIPVIVFVVMVVWASNVSYSLTHNPELSSPQFQGKSIINDDSKLVATGTITFAVQNRGNNSAYKTSSTVCYASDATPTNIQKGLTAISPNPLKPQDYLLYYLSIQMPYWLENGEWTTVSSKYYIFYKVGYTNTPNGKPRYEEYWFEFDFNNGKETIAELTLDEVNIWKPFVYSYFANLDTK